jgi:hypothetical protein
VGSTPLKPKKVHNAGATARIWRQVRTVVAQGGLLSSAETPITGPLQGCLKDQADRIGEVLQVLAADLIGSPAVPLVEQLVLQIEQIKAQCSAYSWPLGDGRQIPPQVGPADLPMLLIHPAVGAVAIRDQDAGKVCSRPHCQSGCRFRP